MRAILWSGVQCTLDDLGNLSIRDSWWPTRPVFVSQPFDTNLYGPPAPLANRVLVDPKPLSHILVLQTLRAPRPSGTDPTASGALYSDAPEIQGNFYRTTSLLSCQPSINLLLIRQKPNKMMLTFVPYERSFAILARKHLHM